MKGRIYLALLTVVVLMLVVVRVPAPIIIPPQGGGGVGGTNVIDVGPSLLEASNYYARVVLLTTNDNLTTTLAAAQNNTAYILSPGNYTVTPSVMQSNLTAGNSYSGVSIANKTNVLVIGTPGQSIIDGSGSLGEALWTTNCSRIRFESLVFKGYTNHNFMALPAELWSLVAMLKCENMTYYNCDFIGSADHGLSDYSASPAATLGISSNNIVVDTCRFSDIGSFRTNSGGGGSISVDGTAIVPTGWTIRNCVIYNCMRGIEPFDFSDANGQVFKNCKILNCTFYNIADSAITLAGSTNGWDIEINGNQIFDDISWSYHGTNLLTTGKNNNTPGYGILLNGGRGHRVLNNKVYAARSAGVWIGGSTPLLDVEVSGNEVNDVGNGSVGSLYLLGNENSTVNPVTRLKFSNNRGRNAKGTALNIIGVRDGDFSDCVFDTPTLQAGAYGININSSGNNANTNLTFQNVTVRDTSATMGYGAHIATLNSNIKFVASDIQSGTTARFLDDTAGAGFTEYNLISGNGSQIARLSDTNYVTSSFGSVAITNTIAPGALLLTGTNGVPALTQAANSNSVAVTNIIGLLHKAYASVVVLDMNHGNRFAFTNRAASANTTLVVTNLAQGQEFTITMLGESAANDRTVTIVPQLGYLVADLDTFGVALALNKTVTLTNNNGLEISGLATYQIGTNFCDIATRQYKR